MKEYIIYYILIIFFSFSISQTEKIQNVSCTLSGFISDYDTGESIVGANVYLIGTDYGSSTDLDGYFIIFDIPSKNYNLHISYLGYEKIEKTLLINKNSEINLELIPKPLLILLNK